MRTAQSGLSLVSLMVGLVISMLVVLTTLSIYRATIRTTVDASQGAHVSGQFSSGLLAAQMKLQGAGFGIIDPDSPRDITVAASGALVWRDAINGAERCHALVFSEQRLRLLSSTSTCTDANTALEAATWNETQLVSEATGDNRSAFTATVIERECSPFGVTKNSAGRLLVELQATALKADGSADPDRPMRTATVCLSNFAADPADESANG